ncbi:S41 family peptidase [Thalassotalea atypica]|uniref:S41 family peptidase n=1 Tax=Thalassotalea atypica TaxID=2054316 RepID=UPI002572A68A|nr:S41 family peptidase [Thalassotalea atypica]
MNKYIILILLVCLSLFQKSANAQEYLNTLLQPEQVSEDLEQWLTFLNKTHPQLSYTVDNVDAFHADVEKLKASITQPISILELWRHVSVFNSVLSDGHTVINLPKIKTLANQHVKNGGGLFPFEVVFRNDKLIIKSQINGEATAYRGNEITHINGVNTSKFIAPLLKRTNGDSVLFRRALLQRRLAEYIWLYYGEIDSFVLTLNKYGQQQIKTFAASHDEFNLDDNFEEQFSFEILDKNSALLTLNTFSWGAEYKRVIDFLHQSFSQIAQNKIDHLIIDIRENGGGDDVIWIDGILPYLADKKWRTGSKYKAKIIEGRADEGETIGDVVEGENSFRELDPKVNKFTGDVSVLISSFTYSSSILFANVIQDHQFGQLVGERTGGKSGQTGGTQFKSLKHSNLSVVSPFFYLERPKGGENHMSVTPDIEINYDKTIPEQLVNKLLNQRNVN